MNAKIVKEIRLCESATVRGSDLNIEQGISIYDFRIFGFSDCRIAGLQDYKTKSASLYHQNSGKNQYKKTK